MSVDVIVPKDLWEEDDEAVVTAWMYDGGVRVKEGDVVVEVMMSKTQYEIAAPASGVLEILAAVDDVVQKGSLLARIQTG